MRDGFRDAEELAQQVYADLALAIEEDFPVAQKSDQAQRVRNPSICVYVSVSVYSNNSMLTAWHRRMQCTRPLPHQGPVFVRCCAMLLAPRPADPHTADVKHTDIGYQMRNFIYSETESLTVVTGTRLFLRIT